MAGLQRSAVSFRRQGSSGFVWDDRFLSGELEKMNNKEEGQRQDEQERQDLEIDNIRLKEIKTKKPVGSINTIVRSRSYEGGRGLTAGKVSPGNDEPPSPKLSACGFCGLFGGNKGDKPGRKKSSVKRRIR